MELNIVNDLTKNLSVKKNQQNALISKYVNFSEVQVYLFSICLKNIS